MTLEKLKLLLQADEPKYSLATTFGSDALPHLETLARGEDESLAARAVYFASLIQDSRAVALVAKAASSQSVVIRVQAAAGARNLPKDSIAGVLAPLLDDPDAGIRAVAVKTTKAVFPAEALPLALREKLSRHADSDPEPSLRELSKSAL